jgi:hypothetical protein
VVIALAGRRIDASDAETPRFPLRNVPLVEGRLAELFTRAQAGALVGSAACGADLVAMTLAGARKMRRRVVLPFARERFRVTSVIDRPGDWGSVYDGVLAELDPTGDVVTLAGHGEDTAAYVAVNAAILDEALALAGGTGTEALAAVVWDGAARGQDDLAAAFAAEAARRGLRLAEVRTL